MRDYIDARWSQRITLGELAAVSGLSLFHLAHAFAARFGLAPHAYQLALRVERARALLKAGERPAAVAAEVGFADQSHFNRHFKKLVHLSPSGYMRMVHPREAHSRVFMTRQ